MRLPSEDLKSVLVTGCSSGIGATTAEMLRRAGWKVLPTARKPEDLERLRQAGFDPIELDIAKSDSVQKAADETLSRLKGRVGAIVNNAGFGQPGAMEDLTREAMRYQFEVNLFGMQELTNRLIPVFREQGWGRIVNISSVVGRISLPFFGIYSASKFAMEAVSDAMRVELRETGIDVVLVEPGPIASAFRDNAVDRGSSQLAELSSHFDSFYERELTRRTGRKSDAKAFMLPPESVGRAVLRALESDRPGIRYKVTIPAYIGAWMSRWAPPRLVDAIMWRRWSRRVKSP